MTQRDVSAPKRKRHGSRGPTALRDGEVPSDGTEVENLPLDDGIGSHRRSKRQTASRGIPKNVAAQI